MKTKLKKMRMVRLSDAFLPLALMIAALLGRDRFAENIFRFTLIARVFALATSRGLRLAFSEQLSLRRVRGSVKAALPMQLAGGILLLLADFIYNKGVFVPVNALWALIAVLLNVEQVFYEYLWATGDSESAVMARSITSGLIFGGLMLTSRASTAGLLPYGLEWPVGAAALSTAVACAIGFRIGGGLKGKLNAGVFRCAPRAMLQCLAYTLIWLAVSLIPASPIVKCRTGAPFFAGLTVYELCRAPFRRTQMESREMNRVLLFTAGAMIAAILILHIPGFRETLAPWWNDALSLAIAVLLGAGAGFGMYGHG